MKNYILPFLLLLISCNGSDDKNVVIEPQASNGRNVYISAPSQITIVENSQLQVEISINGDFLQTDLIKATSESDSLNVAITSDKKFLLLKSGSINNETELDLNLSIEGPSNAPNTKIHLKILDSSGMIKLEEALSLKKSIEEILQIDEEIQIAKKLSPISPMIISDKNTLDSLLNNFVTDITNIESSLQKNLNYLEQVIGFYQTRLTSELELVQAIDDSKLILFEFKFQKLKFLNEYLTNSSFSLQIPFEVNNRLSNFFGNTKIGLNDDKKFSFSNEYSFLNEMLATECK